MRNYVEKVCICCIIGLSFSIVSCDGLIEIDQPPTLITSDKLFDNPQLLQSATVECYRKLEDFEAFFPRLIGLYSDELGSSSFATDIPEYLGSAINSKTSMNLTLWRNLYSVIYQANILIEGLPTVRESISDDLKKRVAGESRFLRAYCYFYLVNLWGDVPLIVTTNINVTATQSRDEVSKVYELIVSDLEEAENLLEADYENEENVRATRYAANALLARVFLHMGRWQNAEASATKVIDSERYHPADIIEAFKAGNPETILQLWNEENYTGIGTSFIPISQTAIPANYITSGLLVVFDEGDLRKNTWLDSNVVDGHPYYFPYKYKTRTVGDDAEYITLLRLSEQYLIRAEARARQNKLAEAISDINVIRGKAGLGNLPSSLTQSQILAAIEAERRTELFCESGHRFFDLKRTGRIDEIMGNLKSTWKSHAALFPLPEEELDANPFLVQNPGYE